MGHFYLAWVNSTDTTFGPAFARDDESVLAFELKQEENDFAKLAITVRNPRIGLLNPARKRWAWLSYSDSINPAQALVFGQLVGIPTSVLDDKVTLEFIARPLDWRTLKETMADTLRVLPQYDPIFIDEQSRDDPDIVLEGYSRIWHWDRVTHALTASDILIAEDGLEEFFAGDLLHGGLSLDLEQAPATRAKVTATFGWLQQAAGELSLTEYLVTNWPNESPQPGVITSFTLQENDWPRPAASIGDGWSVSASIANPLYSLDVLSESRSGKSSVEWGEWLGEGGSVTLDSSNSDQYIRRIPPGSILVPRIVTKQEMSVTYGQDGELTGMSQSADWTNGIIPLHYLRPELTAAYLAERPRKETVTFTLTADVQPILTDPGPDAAIILTRDAPDLHEQPDDADAAIDDPRRRSYIVTERGLESLKYLIAVARAHLLKRSRCVKITFALVDWTRIFDITLRKSARIHDPRLPGGQADGKIIGYSLIVDGNSERVDCTVTMGCAVGRGGTVTATPGTPTWAEIDYVGADYQEFTGRTVLFDSSVGFEVPTFQPNDDGLDFIAGITVADAIEQALTVQNPPATQRTQLLSRLSGWLGGYRPPGPITPPDPNEEIEELVTVRANEINEALEAVATVAKFKLKSMKASFDSTVSITVTQLKVPTMIDLEAA